MNLKITYVAIIVLLPATVRAADIDITMVDGRTISVRTIGEVLRDSVVVVGDSISQTLPIDSISRIQTVKTSDLGRGILVGVVGGAAAGFVFGKITQSSREKETGGYSGRTGWDSWAGFTLAGGMLGGIIGGAVGSHEKHVDFHLAAMSQTDRRITLRSLKGRGD